MHRIVVLNGPNLNLIGVREPGVYGNVSLDRIQQRMREMADRHGVDLDFYQSNHEGELIDIIQSCRKKADCIIINAGGLTHYSVSLHDALRTVEVPVIEIHMTNIYAREEFRHRSLISPVAIGGIFGFGSDSYYLALQAALDILQINGGNNES
jgi:3-dehydroquinate dehydratase-2